MVGGGSKRKCSPVPNKVGPAKKKKNVQKVQQSSQPAELELEEIDSHFNRSKPNLKKRKRSAIENDKGKDVAGAEVKRVIEVVLDDEGEEIGGEKMKDESKPDDIQLLISSSPGLECEDDVSENVKTENEVEARVKVENVDNLGRDLDEVREAQTNGRQDGTGWLTIPSLPLGWKFREVSTIPEVPLKVSTTGKEMAVKATQELSTNKRQFIMAPNGKIFPSRFLLSRVMGEFPSVSTFRLLFKQDQYVASK